ITNTSKTVIDGKKIFNKSIELDDIWFKYPEQEEYTIKGSSIKIPIGKSIAFIGESGSGKTTLLDIILGLLDPERGKVFVDDKDLFKQKEIWKKVIGYIPQNIFLSDDTIRSNVAFGIEEEDIDEKAVWRALEQAQLKKFVESLPKGINTRVGERGTRLSGGQRQRIGIARSLYHNPEILFMDEATSALDNETESEIMKSIEKLKGEKTIIIIAHRLSTIENCDIVYKICDGKSVLIRENQQKASVRALI
ncbi:MAG: ATP-binding cassette domain-containing protein, partial [Campylobacterales bacterium]|nr:ATP-binding cassette domain-containing protein [Campylobacterales bacterium]